MSTRRVGTTTAAGEPNAVEREVADSLTDLEGGSEEIAERSHGIVEPSRE